MAMKKILVFGTFDIFHEGHKDFLRQARQHGNFLRVVVARDETVVKVKKRTTLNTEEARRDAVAASKLTDEVILGNLEDKYAVVKEFRPDVICLGYDQMHFTDSLEKKIEEFGFNTKIIRLKSFHPEKYKSSLLRAAMKQ